MLRPSLQRPWDFLRLAGRTRSQPASDDDLIEHPSELIELTAKGGHGGVRRNHRARLGLEARLLNHFFCVPMMSSPAESLVSSGRSGSRQMQRGGKGAV